MTVKMKAVDTLFISSWSSENIPPKGEFEVSAEQAKSLEDRGLATRVGGAKMAAPHENKMEPAPENKADSKFDHDGDGKAGGAPKGGNRKAKAK